MAEEQQMLKGYRLPNSVEKEIADLKARLEVLEPGLEKAKKADRMVDYVTYRELTGKCETCNAPMNAHPTCDACGILCGTGHFDGLPSPYRGHNLCGHCIVYWKNRDKVLKREATWDEFLSGKTKP